MQFLPKLTKKWAFIGLLITLSAGLTARASTTPGVAVEILGIGAASLLGGDLTDPENDGADALGAALEGTWNWEDITSSHEPDFEGGENSFNIFDNKVGGGNDKWCCDDPIEDQPVWVAVKFPQAVTLSHFTVTSGNDSPDRDPTDWAIQGSNDGETFTDIYRFVGTPALWTARNQVLKFTLPGSATTQAYSWIRYIAYVTPGTLHQLNEIEYFGAVGGLVDTDNDGMPDDYEVSKGFNPNNPADAALDFDGDGATNLAEYLAGSDPIDVTKPTLLSVRSTGTLNQVILTFSEDLDPATATAVANYSITPSLAVNSVTYSGRVATLNTAAQTPGGTMYTVGVSGVQDLSKNAIEANTSGTFFSYLLVREGVLKFSFWGGITGTPVDNLLNDPRYPASPDSTGAVFSFNTRDILPNDAVNDYGATIEGYITPQESGSYHFFLRSDDASQLYISTDDSEANLVWQAEEFACCSAFLEPGDATKPTVTTAEPIAMVANQRYFVRVLYKEGGGGDFAQVAWRREGDTTPAASLLPIPGRFLSAAVDLPAPAEGSFLTQTPAPNATGVSPDATITISHRDGKTPWTAENVTMQLNGSAVTPTVVKTDNLITISYKAPSIFPSASVQTVTLGYLDPAGQPTSMAWSFTVATYKGPLLDEVASRPAILLGAATQTEDRGGHTGNAGDYALDTGTVNGTGYVLDATFVSASTADDTLTVAFWQKLRSVRAGSAFWLNSPSSNNGTRGFQAHAPWSDSTIYFDTSGCCGADTQRINLNIDNYGGYTGDATWWQDWHHFAFVKDGATKSIYINGELFHQGGGDPLPTDFTTMVMGGGPSNTENRIDGMLDDMVIYGGALTDAQVASLAGGAAPSSVTGLVAHWDFNDPPTAAAPMVSVAKNGANVVITYTGILQGADSVNGPYTDVAGASSPYSTASATGMRYFRARNP
jgi:hypothetical protein